MIDRPETEVGMGPENERVMEARKGSHYDVIKVGDKSTINNFKIREQDG